MRSPDRLARLDATGYALPDELVARLSSPALIVDLERARANVRRVVEYVGGADRWRAHLKTTKTPELWDALLDASVRNFKCATVREARVLLAHLRERGIEGADLLVAYPHTGPALAALSSLARAFGGTRLGVLVEDPDVAAALAPELSIFVDVNPGMHRTGLPLDARDEILAVAHAAGRRFRGVHYYEGHLHAGGPAERRREVFACHDALLELTRELAGAGVALEELVTSGTPAFQAACAYPAWSELEHTRHRVSPGTVVLHDWRSDEENEDLELQPAAYLFTRVVSQPRAGIVTCDAGSKSIAAEAPGPCAFALGRPELSALTPSEEHLPFEVTAGTPPARGTPLWLVPRHVCPTVNLAEDLLLVDGADVRAARVRARAHDLFLDV